MSLGREFIWFGSVIRNRRKNMGLTLQALADVCGCTKAYLSTIETGKSPPPSSEILNAMEIKLGYAAGELVRFAQATQATESVTWMVNKALDQILDKKKNADSQDTESTINMDQVLRQIVPEAKEAKNAAESLDSDLEEKKNEGKKEEIGQAQPSLRTQTDFPTNVRPLREPLVRIPLLNEVTAGRYPNLRTDLDYPAGIADRYVEVPGISDPNAFACTVLGESMMPRYMPGDVVIFAPNEQVLSGDDCFVRLASTETTFKRVIDLGEGQLRLMPLNPAYQPWEVNREEVTGLWRAVRRIECLSRRPHRGDPAV